MRTRASVALGVVVAGLAATVLGVGPALAASTGDMLASESPIATAQDAPPTDDPPLVAMPQVDPETYVAAAAVLPDDMVASLESDVGVTPEEYLAIADAAAASEAVIAGLEANGVDILATRMEGTDLVVSVADPVDVGLVASVGAVPDVSGDTGWVFDETVHEVLPLADLSGGEGWVWSDASADEWVRCSTGFNGFAASTGAPTLVTAGHCLSDWTSADGTAYRLDQSAPTSVNGATMTLGDSIGLPSASSVRFGPGVGADAALIAADGVTAVPRVVTWGGGQSSPTAGTPVTVKGAATAVTGAILCRSGSTTGWRCGTILSPAQSVSVGGSTVVSVIAEVCALPGDSGGAAVMGAWAVGVTSWRTGSGDVCASDQILGVSPLRTTTAEYADVDIESQYSGVWELAVAVATPTVVSTSGTSSGVLAGSTTVTGSLADSTADSSVRLFVDGTSQSTQSASTGSWSLSFPSSVSAGIHIYEVQGRSGQWSASAGVSSGRFTHDLAVSRYAGADRYATAIAISQAAFPTGSDVPVVYVASGLNYPDALSAAPAAGAEGGALLLVGPSGVTDELRAELLRLAPERIVVVGGEPAVSADVFSALQTIPGVVDVVRIGGADRYETSRLIVDYAFDSAPIAYVATGWSFPDALSAAAVGAARSWPVLLVNGATSSADAATIALLDGLGVGDVKVLGSAAAVSDGILDSLRTVDSAPQRIGGSDRFATSALVATDAFSGTTRPTAFIATGLSFPDALAGAVLAGTVGAPLVISWSDCVTPSVLAALDGIGTTGIGVLGSTAALARPIEWMQECR